MSELEIVISGLTAAAVLVLAIYATVFLVVYRRLFPRLAPRIAYLPILLISGQALLLTVHASVQHTSSFVRWLLNLDSERNIANVLASTQLAYVSAAALAIAWLASSKSRSQRGYFLTLSLAFLFLAQEEFTGAYKAGDFPLSNVIVWHQAVQIIGILLVALTAWAALRSSRRTLIWHLCFIVGLALMGIAGLLIDEMPFICNVQAVLRLEGCISRYVLDESFEFLGSWLALVAMLGHFSAVSPPPKTRARRGLFLLPAVWIPLLLWHPLYLALEAPLLAQPVSVHLESNPSGHDTRLRGYRLGRSEGMITLDLFTVARRRAHSTRGYSVHLLDQASAESIASVDTHWKPAAGPMFGSSRPHAYRQRIDLAIPPGTAANRALWVVLTFWREIDGRFTSVKVVSSDQALLSETQVILGEIVLPAKSLAVPTETLAEFDNGITLYAAGLPESARIGDSLSITFTWGSAAGEHDEYVQYLHVGHVESGEWWVLDRQPLGARLPTRLWYSGLVDSESWDILVPADRARGEYQVFTGLYRTRDRERLPARDVAGVPFVDARVPLGAIIIN